MPQEQSEPPRPSGASTSAATDHPPLPQTSSSTPSNTSFTQVHSFLVLFSIFLTQSQCIPLLLLLLSCITLHVTDLLRENCFLYYDNLFTLVRSHMQVKSNYPQAITVCKTPRQTTKHFWSVQVSSLASSTSTYKSIAHLCSPHFLV